MKSSEIFLRKDEFDQLAVERIIDDDSLLRVATRVGGINEVLAQIWLNILQTEIHPKKFSTVVRNQVDKTLAEMSGGLFESVNLGSDPFVLSELSEFSGMTTNCVADQRVDNLMLKQLLLDQLNSVLSPRASQIVLGRLGLVEPAKTYAELGKEFGVTKERVRQIEIRSIEQIRSYPFLKLIFPYLKD